MSIGLPMTLPKYRTSDYTIQPHPHGEYYRVADVDPVLDQREDYKKSYEDLRDHYTSESLRGQIATLRSALLAAKKFIPPRDDAYAQVHHALAAIKETQP